MLDLWAICTPRLYPDPCLTSSSHCVLVYPGVARNSAGILPGSEKCLIQLRFASTGSIHVSSCQQCNINRTPKFHILWARTAVWNTVPSAVRNNSLSSVNTFWRLNPERIFSDTDERHPTLL